MGPPRFYGELLKLGIEISQAAVSKYLVHHHKPPSQGWRTFLRNHMGCSASVDFFVVPTATFRLLFVFIVLTSRAPSHRAFRRYRAPHIRMGRAEDPRILSVGYGATLSDP